MSARHTNSSKSIGPSHAGTVRVTYHDTDRMGHVYYAKYLVWFEIGRNELLRSLGQRYREWEEQHRIFLPVTSCSIDYKKSAQYDDVVRVETHVTAITKASITFHYDIRLDETGELLAHGGTRHAFVTADGKVARVAQQFLPQYFK
jgi:acyl-CoA thioester hydrolase